MADVEALGDVDGAVIQHHALARAAVVRAVAVALRLGGGKHALGVDGAVDEEIEVAAHGLHARKEVRLNGGGELVGDHHRRLAQRLGEFETGEGVIAQLRVRRHFQHGSHVRGLQRRLRQGGKYLLRDGKPEIHEKHAPV